MTEPTSTEHLMQVLLWVAAIGGAAWLVFGVLGAMHRRAFNATPIETKSASGVQLGYLEVDDEKRAAAIKAGNVDPNRQRPLLRTNAGKPISPAVAERAKMGRMAKTIGLISAVASFIAAALVTLHSVPNMHDTALLLANYTGVIRAYPIGFAIAAIVIIGQLIQLIIRQARQASS